MSKNNGVPEPYQRCPRRGIKRYSLAQIEREMDPNTRRFICIHCSLEIYVDENMFLCRPSGRIRSASSRRRRIEEMHAEEPEAYDPDTADTLAVGEAVLEEGKQAEEAFKAAREQMRIEILYAMARKPVLFGRYRVYEILGEGANAVVVAAQDLEMIRQTPGTERPDPVAIKFSPGSAVPSDDGRLAARRVRRSVEVQRHFDHKSVPSVLDLLEHDEYGTVVVEQRVMGIPLKQVLDSGKILPEENAAAVASQLLSVLILAEQMGIVHRDIKPANIMVELDRDAVVLIDFGEARCNETDGRAPYRLLEPALLRGVSRTKALETLTQEGEGFGTLFYMAPEQADGARVDSKTDIYGLGATLYHMVTGRVPLRGVSTPDQVELIRVKDPKPAIMAAREAGNEISQEFSDILAWALHKDPARRPSPSEMMAALLKRKVVKKPKLSWLDRLKSLFSSPRVAL